MNKLTKTEVAFNKLVDLEIYKEKDRENLCKARIMVNEPIYKYYNLEESLNKLNKKAIYLSIIKKEVYKHLTITTLDLNILYLLENGNITYEVFTKYVSHLNYFINSSDVKGFFNLLLMNIDNNYSFNVSEVELLFDMYKREYLEKEEYKEFLPFVRNSFIEKSFMNTNKKSIMSIFKHFMTVDYPFILGSKTYDNKEELIESINPLLLYHEDFIDEWKLNMYLKYTMEIDNTHNLFYVLYIETQNDFSLSYDELRFLLLEAKYTEIYNKQIYLDLMNKKLNKNQFYKTSILLSNFDFDFETLNKHIFNTILGEKFFTEPDIIEIGHFILDEEIDFLIDFLEKPKKIVERISPKNVSYVELIENKTKTKQAVFIGRQWGKNLNLIAYFRDFISHTYFKINIYKNYKSGIYGTYEDFRDVAINSLVSLDLEEKTNKKTHKAYTKLNNFKIIEKNVLINDVEKYDIENNKNYRY